METEKIISTLIEKVGTTGLSQRTISDYVNNNLLPEGSEPDDAYFTKHASVLKSLSGNYDHDLAGKIDEFKKNYKVEKPHGPIEQPSPIEQPKPFTNDIEARIKALEESQNAKLMEMQNMLDSRDKALEEQNYLHQVEGVFKNELKENGVVYDKIYFENIANSKGVIDVNRPVSDTVKTIREKYDALFKENGRQSSNTGFTNDFKFQEADGKTAIARREAYKQKLIKEGKLPNPNTQK